MQKVKLVLFLVAILNLYFQEICSDESSEEAYPNYEYMQIFRGVPALFEYLLNAVEENPEMLEKNDITMFKRNMNTDKPKNERERQKKQAAYKNPEQQSNSDNCKIDQYQNTNHESRKKRNSNGKETGDYTEPRTIAYEYGNSILLSCLDDNSNNCKIDTKRELDQENVRASINNKMLNNKIHNRDVEVNDKIYSDFSEPGYKDYDDVVWANEEEYLGIQNIFGLDVQPDEIKEAAVLAEKRLEDHNNKRRS